jgi:hypothetical protein
MQYQSNLNLIQNVRPTFFSPVDCKKVNQQSQQIKDLRRLWKKNLALFIKIHSQSQINIAKLT